MSNQESLIDILNRHRPEEPNRLMSPLDEFIRDSHELKQQILDQALKENAALREQVADLKSEVEARDALLELAQARMSAMAAILATLSADHRAPAH